MRCDWTYDDACAALTNGGGHRPGRHDRQGVHGRTSYLVGDHIGSAVDISDATLATPRRLEDELTVDAVLSDPAGEVNGEGTHAVAIDITVASRTAVPSARRTRPRRATTNRSSHTATLDEHHRWSLFRPTSDPTGWARTVVISFAWRVTVWLVLLTAAAALAAAVAVPRLTGATPYTVTTGSMRPGYPPGALVVVKPLPVERDPHR